MLLFFFIALGTALAALLLGLILRAKLGGDEVWEELVGPNAPPEELQSEDQQDSDERPSSQDEEVNSLAPALVSRSPQEADLRRSSRIERSIPLLILCTNRHGQTFQEKTSAVAVNLHGCRYPSRHEYVPESWVTLQVTGTEGANSPLVRGRVRSILATQTRRELCQVGIELETPGNVWGIPAPPEDWQRLLDSSISSTQSTSAVAPAAELSTPRATFLGNQSAPPEHRAEVTVFPGTAAAAAHAAEVAPGKEPTPAKPERVVFVAEKLLHVLQGRIQLAADKAVQTSLSTQLEQAVKIALARINDAWRAKLGQTEELSAARVAEVQELWEKELAVYLRRAEEISLRLDSLAGNSQPTLAESQKFVDSLANETAPQLQAGLDEAPDCSSNETEATVQVSKQQLSELAESAQPANREAHPQFSVSNADLRSLQTSTGVSQELVETLIHTSREKALSRLEDRLGELWTGFEQQHDLARHRTEEIARRLESLAAETCQTLSQHEQALSEVRTLLANMDASNPQERLVSLLNSSREQILGHLEEFGRRVEVQIDLMLAEAKQSITSSLAALDAEGRTIDEATRRALEPKPKD